MIRRLLLAVAAAVGFLMLAGAAIWIRGATLPASHTATGESDVPAPPERVFARLGDPAAYPAWRKDVKNVRVLGNGRWIEVGSQGTLPFRFAGRAAPRRLETVVDSTTLPFSGTWTFELEPAGSGTRVRVTERGTISSPPLRALAPLFSPPDRTLRRYLTDLRASFARE
jgi:uncharacterized protein YndB with AHSA1/START domain